MYRERVNEKLPTEYLLHEFDELISCKSLVVIIVVKWFRYIYAKEKRKCRIMYIQFLYLKQDRT